MGSDYYQGRSQATDYTLSDSENEALGSNVARGIKDWAAVAERDTNTVSVCIKAYAMNGQLEEMVVRTGRISPSRFAVADRAIDRLHKT